MPSSKKSAPKKSTKKAAVKHSAPHRHLRPSKVTGKFWNLQPSVQSIYWLLIGVGVIGTTIINFNTNLKVNDLLDQVDAQNQALETTGSSTSIQKAD